MTTALVFIAGFFVGAAVLAMLSLHVRTRKSFFLMTGNPHFPASFIGEAEIGMRTIAMLLPTVVVVIMIVAAVVHGFIWGTIALGWVPREAVWSLTAIGATPVCIGLWYWAHRAGKAIIREEAKVTDALKRRWFRHRADSALSRSERRALGLGKGVVS